MKLKIDPEFRDKIPPLTESEFKQLEENILSDGIVREPIITWNNTIIDGHHRWKIIQNHPEIPYKVTRMIFPDKWAAIVWMCKNQLGKRNLTDEQKSYLIGKEYEAMKKASVNTKATNIQIWNVVKVTPFQIERVTSSHKIIALEQKPSSALHNLPKA